MVTRLKLIEYFAIFFVIFVFTLTAGKYYFPVAKDYIEKNNISIAMGKNNDTKQGEKTVTTHDLVLRKDVEYGYWQLYNPDQTENRDFIIEQGESGNISIKKNELNSNSETKLVTRVGNVHTYFSQIDNPIETEIPFDGAREGFQSFEQEDVVPIIGYHFIVPDGQVVQHPELEMTQSDFREQVKFLTEELGCRWFTLQEVMTDHILKDRKVPRGACIMNFDDGRRNNFTQALPVLEEFGVKATFYIITDRIDSSDEYMTWDQVDTLYERGHELGSHTVNSGSLVDDLGDKGGTDAEKLQYQLDESLNVLRGRGYNTTTFAYPRGEWNDAVVTAVKNAGYIVARDIRKKDTWREKRTTAIGIDDEFIWHMHYIKPERMNEDELRRTFMYDGWWQFEEDFESFQEDTGESDIKIISSARPTDRSYAVVSLNAGQDISSAFRVSRTGKYNVEFLGALSKTVDGNAMNPNETIEVFVDNKRLDIGQMTESDCSEYGIWHYCIYGAQVELGKGKHTLTMKSLSGQVLLDKFRMFRRLPIQEEYDIKIVDIVTKLK